MKNYCFLCILLILSYDCHRNRLKNDENALAKEILTEEEQLEKERQEREKQLADSIVKLPRGFRFKEQRGVNPACPPQKINIINNRKQKGIIKTSNLLKKIRYIPIETVPDSIFSHSASMDFFIGNKHIYGFSRLGGIVQFDLEGHFLGYVCRNKQNYIRYPDGQLGVDLSNNADQKWVWQAYYADGKLCYKYFDRKNKTVSYYLFDDIIDCPTDLNLLQNEKDRQTPTPKGEMICQGTPDYASKSTTLFPLGSGMFAISQNRKPVEQQLPLISIVSKTGDTLCTFPDYDPVRNFSHSVYRNVESYYSYYLNHACYFKPAYNDTIYQIIPPDNLIAKYILDFGNQGINESNKALAPNIPLDDKFILDNLLETRKFIFITYTKNYATPNTAKDKKLWYSRLIYNKTNNTILPVYSDQEPQMTTGYEIKMPTPSAPELNIENDLDRMPFIWPQGITASGNPYAATTRELDEPRKGNNHKKMPDNSAVKGYLIMIYEE